MHCNPSESVHSKKEVKEVPSKGIRERNVRKISCFQSQACSGELRRVLYNGFWKLK